LSSEQLLDYGFDIKHPFFYFCTLSNWNESPNYICQKDNFLKLKKINFFLMFLSSSSVNETTLGMATAN